MTNFIDLLKGIKSKIGSNKVNIQPVQVAENGGMDLQATMELAQRQPKTPFERIFGRNIEIDTDTQNPTTGEITTERVTKFQPGMLNDIASGAKENYTQGFSPYNLQDNIGTEGQNKGLAYKIGEGAGTLGRGLRRVGGALGRFADTPLGRAAIMAGVVGATGGSGLQALAYGGTAGMMNQQNRMKDQMYRNELQKMGFDTSGINGYIGDDTFNKIFQSKQLQDNAEYRNALLQTNKANQEFANKMAQDKLEYQKQQDRIENQQRWTEINNKAKDKGLTFNNVLSLANHFDTLPEVKSFKEIDRQYGNVEKTYNAYIRGEIKANAADQALVTTLNKILDPTSVVRESEFERTAAGQSALAKLEGYARKLSKGGSGLTNKEREDLFNTMKIMHNSAYNTYLQTAQTYTDMANRYGINPDDVVRYRPSRQYGTSNNGKSGVTKSGVKYEVIE